MPDPSNPPDHLVREIMQRWAEWTQHVLPRDLEVEEVERFDAFLERLWIEHVKKGGRRPWYRRPSKPAPEGRGGSR